jgi:hypothetical protein
LVRNQDDELNFRLVKAGGLIWQSPLIRSWYRPRSSLKSLFRQYRQYGYWKVRVIRKHGRPASLRQIVPAAFLLGLAVTGVVSATAWVIGTVVSLHVIGMVAQVAGVMFGSMLGAYVVGLVLASIGAAAGTEWTLLPVLPLAFVCHHFGYGLGFLQGVVESGTGRSTLIGRMSRLTR